MHICINTNTYTYIIFYENDSKQKWFNKLSTAAWSCCWQKLLCSISYLMMSIVDPVSREVQLEGSYHLLSCKNYEQLKYLIMKKPLQITRSNIDNCDQREKIRKIILSYLSEASPVKVTSWCSSQKNTLVNDGDIKVIANKF